MKRKIIAIVGPTASGKTGIGVRLAKELGGEIISADSRQVYRGLDIGSGKEGAPFGQNQKSKNKNQNYGGRSIDGIPQWLIDVIDPKPQGLESTFTLFDWLKLAREAIEDIFSRGKVPIIVGGTGLYVQALVEGFQLAPISFDCHPEPQRGPLGQSEGSRSPLATVLDESSTLDSSATPQNDTNKEKIKQLRSILKGLDLAAYEQVDINNPHRLIRAIERAEQGLKPIKIKPDFEVLQIGIDLPREELYKRIDKRVEDRFASGMLEEVIGLIKSGVNPEWLKKLGLEYRIITEFISANWFSPIPKQNSDSDKNVKILMPNAQQKPQCRNGQNFDTKSLDISFGIGNLDFGIEGAARQLKTLKEYQVMKQQLKFKIHALARRQLTWFRRFSDIRWYSQFDEAKAEAEKFLVS